MAAEASSFLAATAAGRSGGWGAPHMSTRKPVKLIQQDGAETSALHQRQEGSIKKPLEGPEPFLAIPIQLIQAAKVPVKE